MENKIKIASSSTLQKLEILINEFYFSSSYYIKDMKIYNNKGLFEKGEVVREGNKFVYYAKNLF